MSERRLLAVVVVAALGSLTVPVAWAQVAQSTDEQTLVAKSQTVSRLYREQRYGEALAAAEEVITLAQRMKRSDVVAPMLYNKACVLALDGKKAEAVSAAREAIAAGYTNYMQFAGDADFESLRSDPDFRALMADLRAKHGPRPLAWDPGRTVKAFPITFDAASDVRLVEMRREFAIDPVVAGMEDDYAKLRALTRWASRQWQHSPTNVASKPDPVTILREAKAGGRFICRDYAIVVAGVARAYGLPSRVLNLMPRDVETRSEAHSVAEVWLSRFNKWVLADGQYGTIPEIDGQPLGGVELQAAIAREDPGLHCSAGAEVCAEWMPFIFRNMFYFKFAADQRRFDAPKGGAQLVLVPKGAPDAKRFAGGNEEVFAGAVYISDPAVFYAPPGVK